MLRSLISGLLLSSLVLLASCKDDEAPATTDLSLRIQLKYGEEDFRMNGTMYINEAGESFTLNDFKFYLSNLVLEDAAGNRLAEPESYHLVRLTEDNAAFEITWAGIHPADYRQLHFNIGVDPAANLSIDQTGDLDPTNQMAWNWNTGYKFLLAEGFYVPAGGAQGLVYHIGSNENLRSGSITLPANTGMSAQTVINLHAQIDRVFGGINTISFAEANEVKGGDIAAKVADNYGSGFLVLDSAQ